MDIRTFKIIIPEVTVTYEVDVEQFQSYSETNEEDCDEGHLLWKLKDDIMATLELGKFGDADYGFNFTGGMFDGTVDDLKIWELRS